MWVDPPVAEILETAISSGSLSQRASLLLQTLEAWVSFDAAWLTVCDPRSAMCTTVGSTGLSRSVLDFVERLPGAEEVWPPAQPTTGWLDGVAEPKSLVDEQSARAGPFSPPSLKEGSVMAMRLSEPGGLHVGFLGMFFRSSRAVPPSTHHRLVPLLPLIAHALSPMRSLLGTARLVHGATAGTAVFEDGTTRRLPGLEGHALLRPGSPVIDIARATLLAGVVFRSFLWPSGGGTSARHVRVTVLAATGVPSFVLGTVMVTPDADVQGLTPRELQVLGLLVDGRSNQQIARRLAVAPRTIAAHVEHLLGKLDVPTRTMAAVHAEREGCYVPPREPRTNGWRSP